MKQKNWLAIASLSCLLTSNASWSCDDLCIGNRAKRITYQAYATPTTAAYSRKRGRRNTKGAADCEVKLNSVEVQGGAPGVVIHQNATIDTLIVNC